MSVSTLPSIKEMLSKRVSLKVCGLTQKSEISSLLEMGVSVIGINFWQQSKRYVSPVDSTELLKQFSGKLLRIGVFVNESSAAIIELLKNDVIDVAQLHGDELPSDCEAIKALGYPVIKAFGVDATLTSEKISEYQAGVDAILLDAHAPEEYGGTGKTFDWQVAKTLAKENPGLPFILAGGITVENIDQAINETGASMIDVASGAEISPGMKDMDKVRSMLDITNQHNAPSI